MAAAAAAAGKALHAPRSRLVLWGQKPLLTEASN